MKRPALLLALLVALTPLLRPAVADARPNAALPDIPSGPNGATRLPDGWLLTPAGHAITLPGDLPLGMVLSPDGKFLLVNTAGGHDHNVDVIDLASEKIAQCVDVDKDWAGLCFNRSGDELYVASGQGYDRSLLNKAAGLGLSPNRLASLRRTVLCFGWNEDYLLPKPALTVPELEGRERWTAGLAAGPDDALYVVETEDDVVVRLGPGARATQAIGRVGYRPVAVAVAPDGRTIAVANWGEDTVSLLDPLTLRERARVRVGITPDALVWGRDGRLFVSCAGSNTVSVIADGQAAETIDTALAPHDLPGSTPDALALSADESRLYVANAGNNDVAVVDTARPGQSRVEGFIPTGWYPTALALSADGKRLYVGVGKGMRSRPNVPAIAPDPRTTADGQRKFDDITRVLSGAVSVVDVPDPAGLAADTQQARDDVPPAVSVVADSAVAGLPPAITHVLYIIREGRTYDQVLGDLPAGNGDPSLALYGRDVTPNAHALAEQFTLLDNLYCNGEVAEDGHAWSDAGYATDYTERVWPGHDSGRDEPDADERLRDSPGGALWDAAAARRVSFYSYGEQAQFTPGAGGTYLFRGAKPLIGHASLDWALVPPGRHDDDRADVFLKDLRAAERTGQWPQLVVMSLPEDATAGAAPGRFTPLASVAANDDALGRIVQGMTRSRFWPSAAIFVIEADPRDGPDHVDAHRTVGFVLSPYVKRHAVDSTLYTTASFLRTIEMLLDLPPLSQYDAHAAPLLDVFTAKPDDGGYEALPARVSRNTRNP